jgi:long-chain acyl-CoA synthetase
MDARPTTTAVTATLALHAARTPARAALIVGTDRVSWRALSAQVERIAAHIAARTREGAGVALHLPNGPALALLFLAAARAGREAQVLDFAWPSALVRKTLSALRPAMIVTTEARLAARRNAVLLPDPLPFARVAAALGAPARYEPASQPLGDVPFYVGFTSGSTGTPKGYRRDHRSWVESFRADAVEFGIGPRDVVLAPGALSHSLFLYAMVHGLYAGATVVLARRFRPTAIPALVRRHRVTVLYGVPTQLGMILDAAARERALTCVRWVLSSGAKWFADALPAVRRLFPAARFAEFYGASELSFIAVAKDGERVPPGSVGRAFSGVRLSIRDRAGRRVPAGRVGRVFVESPFVFMGYAAGGEPDLYRTGDALSVGDRGFLDDAGYLYLVGREGRMIVTSGKNVFPEEIERALETHPAVAAAAVLGLPDARRGERLLALVSLRPNTRVRRAQLVAHLRPALPLAKVPRAYAAVARWPRTSSGKSDFAALTRLWTAGKCEPLL